MKVRGILAALVAITATLTLTTALHRSPQVHAQAVDNSQAVTGQSTLDDLRDLRALRASRSRTVTPLKSSDAKDTKSKFIDGSKRRLHRKPARVTSTPKPSVKQYSHSSVSNGGVYAWAHTRSAFRVANCESGDRSAPDVNTRYNGNPHMRGKYSGKWQMDSDFWSSYGGLKFASTPADASEAEQDAVAYKGFQARGWQPWSCSRIMGVR
jgi:hypothetical protein